MAQERIVAVGLLTERELSVLGPTFDRAWPIDHAPDFGNLLRAIDEAERRWKQNSTDAPEGTH